MQAIMLCNAQTGERGFNRCGSIVCFVVTASRSTIDEQGQWVSKNGKTADAQLFRYFGRGSTLRAS
jgi:hypothetical protein